MQILAANDQLGLVPEASCLALTRAILLLKGYPK
jgi:hypothetical protein